MNIEQQIKERAEKQYPIGFQPNNFFTIGANLREAHEKGALSMLPIMEDVAVSFARWCQSGTVEISPDSYQKFITQVYKINHP